MPKNQNTAKKRTKKSDTYKSFRLQKKISPKTKPLDNPIKLIRRSFQLLRTNWRIFTGFGLVFAVLYLLLVRGLASTVNVQGWLDRADLTRLGQSLNIFTDVVGGTAARGGAAGVLQVVLFVIFSLGLLTIIRAVRSHATTPKIHEVYYFGSAQFVPYFMVLVFTLLMLIPAGFGTLVIGIARQNNLIISNWEEAGFLAFAMSMALASFFLLAGALFSLIVVSMQGVKPGAAIATGWRLVRHRRGPIVVRIIGLFVLLIVLILLTVLPVTFIYAPAAEYVFYAVSIFMIMYAHVYIYELYREMIK